MFDFSGGISMFKKIISIVSAAALGVCCLTGCSNDTAGDKGDKESKELQKITVAEVTLYFMHHNM